LIGVATLSLSLRDVRARSIILARGFASLRLESICCRSLGVFALRLLLRGFGARSLFLTRGFGTCHLLISRGFGARSLFLACGFGTCRLLISRGFGACRLLPLRRFLPLCFELRRGEALGFLALGGGEPFVARFPFRLLSRRFGAQFLFLARRFGARSLFVSRGFDARCLFLPRGFGARCLLRARGLLSLCFELRGGEAVGLSTLRSLPLRLDAGCFIPSCSCFALGCRLLLAFNFETLRIEMRRCESLSFLSLSFLSLSFLSLSFA